MTQQIASPWSRPCDTPSSPAIARARAGAAAAAARATERAAAARKTEPQRLLTSDLKHWSGLGPQCDIIVVLRVSLDSLAPGEVYLMTVSVHCPILS